MIRTGIIGTGNMAHFLSRRLAPTSSPVHFIYGRQYTAARPLADRVGAVQCKSIDELVAGADVVFICVNDDSIEEIAGSIRPDGDKVIVHCSGTKPLALLSRYFDNCGVFWPVYSITKNNIEEHRNIPVMITASNTRAEKILTDIAGEITNLYDVIDEDKRKVLHLLAVMTNNFMTHLAVLASHVAKEKGVLFDWVIPIIRQTARRIEEGNPEQAQTGPAARKDVSTMDAHINLLAGMPEIQEVYRLLSGSIINYHNSKK